MPVQTGTPNNDRIIGEDTAPGMADSIVGLGGNDTLEGRLGNDTINGGDGSDRILGEEGDDLVWGGDGQDWIDGGAGRDTLNGGLVGDYIRAGADGDSIYGEEGNDTIEAGTGDDWVSAGSGDDSVVGGDGNDTLIGESGWNWLRGEAGNDSLSGTGNLYGGDGDDTIVGVFSTDPLRTERWISGGGGSDSLIGTDMNERFMQDDPSDGADYVEAGGGNDTLQGYAGDTLLGGAGDDLLEVRDNSGFLTMQIEGGAGEDTIGFIGSGTPMTISQFVFDADRSIEYLRFSVDEAQGTAGGDFFNFSHLRGVQFGNGSLQLPNFLLQAGDDTVIGSDFGHFNFYLGDGNDEFQGGAAQDVNVLGGNGNDSLVAGAGRADFFGEAGNDTLIGGADRDDLRGGQGQDSIHGGGGDDDIRSDGTGSTVFGGDGDDRIQAQAGSDVDGGAGDDRFDLRGDVSLLGNGTLRGGDGRDSLSWSFDNTTTTTTGLNLTLDATVSIEFLADFSGTNAADYINIAYITETHTSFNPALEADLVRGRGSDTLIGAATAMDVLFGGGNNQFTGGAADDTVQATGGGQNVLLGGDGDDSLRGGVNATVSGQAGNDTLMGGANSSLSGGTGNDSLSTFGDGSTIDAGAGDDTILSSDDFAIVNGGDGHDVLQNAPSTSYAQLDLSAARSIEELQGRFLGTEGDDVHDLSGITHGEVIVDLLGGDDSLLGSGLDDTITGGAGNDTLHGGAGNDLFVLSGSEPSGQDVIRGGTGEDRVQVLSSSGLDYLNLGDDASIEVLDMSTSTSHLGTDQGDFFDLSGIDTLYSGAPSQPGNSAPASTLTLSLLGGDDYFFGGDVLFNTAIAGDDGNDTLVGTSGADTLRGQDGNDEVRGGAGDDVLHGDLGDDLLEGGTGNDTLMLSQGADTLMGGVGNDVFAGSLYSNTAQIRGGEGEDTLRLDWIYENLLLSTENSIETLDFNAGVISVGMVGALGQADNIVDLRNAINYINPIVGRGFQFSLRDGNDQFFGSENAEWVTLLNTNAVLELGGGNDTLDLNEGAFTVDGGDGTDAAIIDERRSEVGLGIGTSIEILEFAGRQLEATTGDDRHDYSSIQTYVDYVGLHLDEGDDFFSGGAPADSVMGGDGNDTLIGNGGGDDLDGNDGDDLLEGGDGNDTLEGGAGNDTLRGGDGNDTFTLTGAQSEDRKTFDGGAGTDRLIMPRDVDFRYLVLDAAASIEELDFVDVRPSGTNLDDHFDISGVQSFLREARIRLWGGDDTFLGGVNAETVDAGTGNDTLSGGGGDDSLKSGDGDDSAFGGDGNDSLRGDDGDDTLQGGAGDDYLEGNFDNDLLEGGDGNDTLDPGYGRDSVRGGAGDDLLIFGHDSLNYLGGEGTDTLRTSSDSIYNNLRITIEKSIEILEILGVSLTGNDDANTFDLRPLEQIIGGNRINLEGGNDTMFGSRLDEIIYASVGDDSVSAGGGDDTVYGHSGEDTLHGEDGQDSLDGGSGDDTLLGNGGQDTLKGQSGNDLLQGGDDDDSLDGESGDDTLEGGAGNDRLLGGNDNDVLRGDAGDDTLDGGRGNDLMQGGDGNDLIIGNYGTDTMEGGGGDDTFEARNTSDGAGDVYRGGDGTDLLIAAVSFENLLLNGAASIEILDMQSQTLRGTDLENQFDFSGIQSIRNIARIDVGYGNDTVTGSNLADDVLGGGLDDVLIGLGGDDALDGETGDDLLEGGAGADTLLGGSGMDTLIGGLGNDSLVGGNHADLAIFQVASTDVTIQLATDGLFIVAGSERDYVADDVETIEFTDMRFSFQDVADMAVAVITGTEASEPLDGTGDAEQINGLGGWDWINPGGGSDTIDGGEGRDMVSFVNLPDTPGRTFQDYRLDIDLGAGTAVNHTGSEQIQLINVERITGTIHADRIRGSDGDDQLRGSGDYDWFIATQGADTLDGGNGKDMVSYLEWLNTDANQDYDFFNDSGVPPMSGDVTGVVVDLNDTGNNTHLAAGHTYVSIERITGSGRQDVFYGDGESNDFRGLGDYDWFVGSAGGRERYFGGDGVDTVTYFRSTSGVTANLRNGATVNGQETGYGTRGDAARDLYFEIENLIGTNFDDSLTGNGGRNQLSGLDGDDMLFGYGGIDQLKGGAGNDTLNGGGSSDYAIFSGDRAEYTITKTGARSATVSSAAEGTDTLLEMEYLRFADGDVAIWDL